MRASVRQAWEAIYRQHRQGFFSLALSITGCPQAAEDAVHEAFVRLLRVQCLGNATAYAFAAVRNAALDHKRRPKGQAVSILDFQQSSDNPEMVAAENEQLRLLGSALARLSNEQREVIVEATLIEKEVPSGEFVPLPGIGTNIKVPGNGTFMPFKWQRGMTVPALPVTTQPGGGVNMRFSPFSMSVGDTSVNKCQSFADGQHTLTVIQMKDGKKMLIAADKKGKVIFQGPINTPEELKQVPEEIRKKLEKIPNMIQEDKDTDDDNVRTKDQPSSPQT